MVEVAEACAGIAESPRSGLKMSPKQTLAAVLSAIVAFIAVGLYFADRSTLIHLTREDGPVEYLTALLYLGAAVCFAWLLLRNRSGRLWSALLALGFFLIAGEEISWGQRIFGIGTPEALKESNVQEEFNFHNLTGVNDNVRLIGTLVFASLYIGLPVLLVTFAPLRRLVAALAFPVPALLITWLALIGMSFSLGHRLLLGETVFQLDEVGEIYLAVAAVAYGAVTVAAAARRMKESRTTA